MDIGINMETKEKITAEDDKVVYSQSLPMPIHLKEDRNVEFSQMHNWGITTVLPFSKYASSMFEKRKPNGKFRLLVDLRKNSSLIADDSTKKNTQLATCQTHYNIWQGSLYSAN